MHRRMVARLAWTLWAIAIVTLAISLFLSAAGDGPLDDMIARAIVIPTAVTVGTMIFARVPTNPVGWVFLGVGVVGGLQSLAVGYADYALPSNGGSQTLAATAAWITAFLWPPTALTPLTFALLLFPDGRLPSRRWRPFPWLAGIGIAAFTALIALNPAATEDERWGLEANPYALEGAEAIIPLLGVLGAAVVPALLGSVAALLVRFRRSRAEQRQQLKWLAYFGSIAVGVSLIAGTLFDGKPGVPVIIAGAQSLIPVSIGLAILRYRLYDIDVVINRTLVYGALTAILAGIYFGLVVAFQSILSPITRDSDVAVAASTLAVAALFGPVRRRVQSFIDRRFYRSRYDAQRTLDSFSEQLREQLDLGALRSNLLQSVAETVQPAHVSLWQREPR